MQNSFFSRAAPVVSYALPAVTSVTGCPGALNSERSCLQECTSP